MVEVSFLRALCNVTKLPLVKVYQSPHAGHDHAVAVKAVGESLLSNRPY